MRPALLVTLASLGAETGQKRPEFLIIIALCPLFLGNARRAALCPRSVAVLSPEPSRAVFVNAMHHGEAGVSRCESGECQAELTDGCAGFLARGRDVVEITLTPTMALVLAADPPAAVSAVLDTP